MVWYTWSSPYSANDLFDYSGLNLFAGGVYEQRPALAAYAASAAAHQGCVKTRAGRLPAVSGARGPRAAPRRARSGSAASRIARTTTILRAPAATTSPTLTASIPPIANHGAFAPFAAA